MFVEPAQGGFGLTVVDGGSGELAGHRGGYGPVSGRRAGSVPAPNRVSSEMTRLTAIGVGTSAGRPVTRSTRVSAMTWPRERPSKQVSAARLSGGVDRDALGHGQQRGHIGHAVGCRPHGDGAFGFGAGGAVDDGVRIEAVGDGFGVGGDARITFALQRGGVGAQFGVERAAVLDVEAGAIPRTIRVARHSESTPDCQGGQGVGHLVDQGRREAEVTAAAGRGFAPGQGDFAGQPAATFGGG